SCPHDVLQLDPSPFAELAGFERADAGKRLAACTKSGRGPSARGDSAELNREATEISRTFPGPLVLPHDDLNYEPDESPQSFRSWLHEKARNKVTPQRKTLYVARVPLIETSVGFMRDWIRPILSGAKQDDGEPQYIEYLAAFYHGLDVKEFPDRLRWTPWKSTQKGASKLKSGSNVLPKYVALAYDDKATRVRTRPAPDGVFKAQLNLNDILDAAIAMLPADAYAILLLVDHDIHEGDDDDFCCGRAYGGSRVAVVQTARYNPLLDVKEQFDYEHLWPASHCKAFIDQLCAVEDVEAKPPTKQLVALSKSGPIRAAIDASSLLAPDSWSTEYQRALWFSRLARTAAHELGHCLGVAHCVYYACNMQGTGGMKEDVRQPPYWCPVCEMKI
ncbi:hypothetical protein BDV95DRAFT_444361, partial [Massariosphaeria phaeospora]